MTAVQPWKDGDWNPFPESATLLPTPANETAWLLQRREGVGASECAAILGLDPYATAFSTWLDKTGQVPLSSAINEAMTWGHLLEPVIRREAADRLGMEVQLCGGLASVERPWQRASLDGVLLTDDGPVPIEVKSTSQYLAADWGDDQVPDRAELQVQHQLAVTGAPYAYVAGLIGGNRLAIRRVERDQVLIDHINAEEEAFWRHVQTGTEPRITARESLSVIVGAAGDPDTDTLVLDEEQASQARYDVAAYEQARLDEKRAQDVKAEARNRLVWLAQGHARLVDGEGVEIARLQRGVVSASRLAADHPEIADLYQRKVERLDTTALRREEPAIFRAYQSVSIRTSGGSARVVTGKVGGKVATS